MVTLTDSVKLFLFENHRDIIISLTFGHAELLTKEIWNEYIEWMKKDEK